MANFMPGEWGEFPMEDQGVFVGAQNKKRMADLLRQQSTTPQGQMVGNVYVAPSITQYLASGLKAYQAGNLDRESNQQVEDLYKNRANVMKTAAQRYAEALRPKETQVGEEKLPFEPNQMDMFGSPTQGQTQATQPVMGVQNPTPQDMFNAQFEYAQSLGDPKMMMQTQNARMNYDVTQQNRQDERAFKAQEAQLQREQRMQEIMLRLQDAQLSREQNAALRREMMELQFQNQRALAGINASNRNPPTPVQVMGGDGKPVYMDPRNAIGKTPYSAKQEAADAQKTQQQEQARISAQQVLDQAATLFQHPGRAAGTGWSSFTSNIPGTDAKGFRANLDTFKAQTFVPMVSALKGMGALSDAEGRKLSESVGALDPSMPEDEFARSLKNITKTLYDKAKANGLNVQMPDFAASQSSVKKRYNPQTGRIE